MSGPSNPCLTCGKPCPPHDGPGRPRKWCSPACGPSKPDNYVPPSRRDSCSDCGKTVQRSWTSAGEIVCLVCRRKRVARKPVTPRRDYGEAECAVCHMVFDKTQARQVYCSASCRESRRPNWPAHVASAPERGYGKEHRDERAKWRPIVEAGQATCCLCGYAIEATGKWHLDHTPERDGYRGVAHAGCNIRDGAQRAARRGNANRPKIQKACATCHSTFTTPFARQEYCSQGCRPSMRRAG